MSRRSFWPDPIEASATEHTHKLPKGLRLTVVALVVCVLALACAVGVLTAYILDARDYRNQQADIMREQIRRGTCDLLDQFPEGGLLDPPRRKYGCGPGIPLEAYPPDVRDRLQQSPGYSLRPQALLPERARPPAPPWPGTGSAPN